MTAQRRANTSGFMSGLHPSALPPPPERSLTFREAIAQSFRQGMQRGARASALALSPQSYALDPLGAVLRGFRRAFDFRGTATRSELIYHLLVTLAIGTAIYRPMQDLLGRGFFVPLWLLAFPMLALHVRRLKDMGWPRLLVAILPVYFPAYLALLAVSLVKGSARA